MALQKPAAQPAQGAAGVSTGQNTPLGSQNIPKQSSPQPPAGLPQVQKTAPAAQANLAQKPVSPALTPKVAVGGSTRGLWIAIVLLGLFSVGSTAGLGIMTFNSNTQINQVGVELEAQLNQQLSELQTAVSALQTSSSDVAAVSESVQSLEEKTQNIPTKEEVETNAEIHKQTDSDLDGLSNYDEVVTYETNPNEKDTDGDGFNDKAEIDNGFNPRGEGLLTDVADAGDGDASSTSNDSAAGAATGSSSSATGTSDDAGTSSTGDTSTSSGFDTNSSGASDGSGDFLPAETDSSDASTSSIAN